MNSTTRARKCHLKGLKTGSQPAEAEVPAVKKGSEETRTSSIGQMAEVADKAEFRPRGVGDRRCPSSSRESGEEHGVHRVILQQQPASPRGNTHPRAKDTGHFVFFGA